MKRRPQEYGRRGVVYQLLRIGYAMKSRRRSPRSVNTPNAPITTDGGLSRTLDVQELATGSYLVNVNGQGTDALHFVKRLTKE